MDDKIKRAIISIAVFVVIYFLFDFMLKFDGYDVYVDALGILTAVIGAGCYWIGSNE